MNRPGFIPDVQRRQREFRRLIRYLVMTACVVIGTAAALFHGLGLLIGK